MLAGDSTERLKRFLLHDDTNGEYLMRILCFTIVAFVVINKLWASAETK